VRPAIPFATSCGSAICARVIATMSASPARTIAAAVARSRTPAATINGSCAPSTPRARRAPDTSGAVSPLDAGGIIRCVLAWLPALMLT